MPRISHNGCACIFDKNEKHAHYKQWRMICEQSLEYFLAGKDDDGNYYNSWMEGTVRPFLSLVRLLSAIATIEWIKELRLISKFTQLIFAHAHAHINTAQWICNVKHTHTASRGSRAQTLLTLNGIHTSINHRISLLPVPNKWLHSVIASTAF